MRREDYDKPLDAFWVTDAKTRHRRLIPCHPEFRPVLARLPVRLDAPWLFVNPRAHRKNKGQYNLLAMEKMWTAACAKSGIKITMYAGLKHSSCSQLVNEKGLTISEVQMLTEHQRESTVRKYAAVEIERRRNLMEGRRSNVGDLKVSNP